MPNMFDGWRAGDLPILAALPALRAALDASPCAVLEAPPGAGKTTVVPLALLDAPWLAGRRILLLEPRRLAARAAAARMAALLGERVGDTVGYAIRLERRVAAATRIVVVTEGILTRMLQRDPALEEAGCVIFDEFHERSLHADLGLALVRESQLVVRDDLRLLVMSATLEGDRVAALLGGAPVVRSDGRLHPVHTTYVPARDDRPVEGRVAAAVRAALAEHREGDVLAFLPGAGEIRRAAELLGDLPAAVMVHQLYGDLPPDAQDAALAPAPAGRRKVVLATSIAETSLTIEGVRLVVDGGLARVPRFDPRSGMARLETVRVSRAAADQRRGRAGRLGPGHCYRCWAEGEQGQLLAHAVPEILEADLAPLALELAVAGTHDATSLAWLDPPPAGALAQARALLHALGALDAAGRVTPHGRAMADLGMHPRLAHMALRARDMGLGAVAAAVATVLEERDLLLATGGPHVRAPVDVRLRVDLVLGRGGLPAGVVARDGALRRARDQLRAWRDRLGVRERDGDVDRCGALLALAYPDRLGRARAGGRLGRFLLRGGLGAAVDPADPLAGEEWLACADLDGRRPESRVFLAAPVTRAEVDELFGADVARAEEVSWDAEARAVTARRVERLGAIVLREVPIAEPDADAVAHALVEAIRREGLAVLPWSDGATRLRERLAFLHRLDGGWPDVSDAALLDTLDDWLAPRLRGVRRLEGVGGVDLHAALLDRLEWAQRSALDRLAPTHCVVPTGSRLPIDYGDPAQPALDVRIQELFGLATTPSVGDGKVPLLLRLLSPAHRPVQATRDLAGFWRTSYFDVRKDLRGRYPKHPWPDDPMSAEPTRRAKPRPS
ncbi:MAG: ATP-dependent helicase HrpB [Gemmatimonadales bacterium]|nr:ATP-dependent helicase HrpB [Gemmatimonadales bacterium]